MLGPRIVNGDDSEISTLLEKLAALGVRRTQPTWRLKPPPPYQRGVVQTDIIKPRWEGSPKKEEKAQAISLRAKFDRLWTEALEEHANDLIRELRAALRRVDREHSRALWQHVRAAFDYPVFTATPQQVGITSTGAEGPSQLPEVLAAYRQFEAWVKTGAKESEMPQFT